MNCKQGDLAVKTGGVNTGTIGHIFVCVCRYDGPWLSRSYAPGWKVDRSFINKDGYRQDVIADEFLRPIRDTDGQDETLTWKDVPHKEVA